MLKNKHQIESNQLLLLQLSRNTSTADKTANSELLASHTSLHRFLHINNTNYSYSGALLNGSLIHSAHHLNMSGMSLISYISILHPN